MAPSVLSHYISAGANRQSHAADSRSSLVAFGAGARVLLWDPTSVRERSA